MKQAVVIGNCQVKSLAQTLNFFSEDVEFQHFQIHSLPPGKAQSHIETRTERFVAEADLVLTFNLSDKYFGLAKDRVRETFAGKPVFSISNLYFGGYHPDIIVLGDIGQRMDGVLDQYHSRLALWGFMNDLSIEDTAALFCDETFRKVNYYSEWDASLKRFVQSEGDVDLPFTQRYVDLLRQRVGMYVVNHPAPVVFLEWAKTLIGALASKGLVRPRGWTPDECALPHHFSDTAIFPVYPEVAAHHNLPFDGSYIFKSKGFDGSSFLSLRQFIQSEFDVFERSGRDAILNSRQWISSAKRFEALDPVLG